MKKIFLIIGIFFSILTYADDIYGTHFICPEIIKPVCGVKEIDNKKLQATVFKYKTFKNECVLEHSDFSLYLEESCPQTGLNQITLPTIVVKPKD